VSSEPFALLSTVKCSKLKYPLLHLTFWNIIHIIVNYLSVCLSHSVPHKQFIIEKGGTFRDALLEETTLRKLNFAFIWVGPNPSQFISSFFHPLDKHVDCDDNEHVTFIYFIVTKCVLNVTKFVWVKESRDVKCNHHGRVKIVRQITMQIFLHKQTYIISKCPAVPPFCACMHVTEKNGKYNIQPWENKWFLSVLKIRHISKNYPVIA
jgi:hypothetical protein